MNNARRDAGRSNKLAALFAAACFSLHAPAAPAAGEDHSQHDMGRDELGRSLYGMKHAMDPALMKELREKIPLFTNYTDAQIGLAMANMGQEYAWYISPPELKGTQGVLILLHGFGDHGDQVFRERVQPMGDIFPTSLGVGMAMMMSSQLQVAVNDLQAAGAKEIAVVPVVSTASNEVYRQWLYIFGKIDQAEYASVPRVKANATLEFVPPPGDDSRVAEILLDYAAEMSKDPKNEIVIITGHGPANTKDNDAELQILANLAKVVKQDGGFADVRGITLQDDAPPPIRAGNVTKLRAMVEDATKHGRRVLIVTNLIGARTLQASLRNDLKGLDYEFNPKGIAQHPNFIRWMGDAIRHVFEKS